MKFVAATNASIEERSRQGEFRSDLLYRLNAMMIDLPPLRKRGDDIVLIAEALIAELQKRYGRSRLHLTADARAALLNSSLARKHQGVAQCDRTGLPDVRTRGD